MVSNGAFVLKEWVQGSHILAHRNHYYWNDAATRLDAVKYLLIPDENAELTRYRGGELHVTSVVPRGQFDWIKANLAGELHVAPQLTTYYYGFNLRRAPFKDHPGLRRALSLVIDREKLAQLVLRVGRAAGLWLGAAGGQQLHARNPSTTATSPLAERHRRGAPAVRAGRLLARASRCASSCATTPARCTPSSPSPIASMWKEALGVEVRLDAGGVQIAAAGHRPRRRGGVPLELGRATTTTPIPSRST